MKTIGKLVVYAVCGLSFIACSLVHLLSCYTHVWKHAFKPYSVQLTDETNI